MIHKLRWTASIKVSSVLSEIKIYSNVPYEIKEGNLNLITLYCCLDINLISFLVDSGKEEHAFTVFWEIVSS